MSKRIDYLDGLRGLGILLVLGFHAYSRYPNIVPYGNQYMDIPIFKNGWLGVQLFFLISGFVIFMSLDRCQNSRQFLYKRWIRLFPAMLIATVLIFITSSFFYERPAGSPELVNLIPGLTFIEPSWWGKLLGINVTSLEWAFWSLYVEFKFYVISSLIFFYLGRDKLVFTLLFLYVFALLLAFSTIYIENEILDLVNNVSRNLSLIHFGWFAAGSAFYLFHQTQKKSWFYRGIFISLISALVIDPSNAPVIGAILLSALFAISLISPRLQSILSSKILLLFGFVSYPLYLIHENAIIAMTVKTHYLLPGMPGYLYPIIPIVILTGTSYIIVKYGEPYLKSTIVFIFDSKSNKKIQRTS